MSISANMLVHRINVSRLIDGGGIKKVTQQVLTNVEATVIPMSREAALANGIVPYKAFELYTNNDTIKVSDVVTESGRRFLVKGANPYRGFGNTDHAMYVLELAE